MITTIVRFVLPRPVPLDDARATFESTAPKYRDMPGLIRKYYYRSEDGATAGGIYLWKTKADALALYTDEWKAFVRGKYGSDPTIEFLDCPVIVDNASDEIIVA
jgi:hypothetical protein